jgi:methylated-DNA-[protein]-cysteine S-methyltransferase
VGRALATNPFPILIPCHRVVRSDGSIGGYGGGPAMKRALLALEGVEVSPEGKARPDRFYY